MNRGQWRMLNETDHDHEGEVLEEVALEEEHSKVFPLPYLLYFVGYCMVLFIDRVVAGHYSHNHERLSAGGVPCPEHQIKSAQQPECHEHHYHQGGEEDDIEGQAARKKNLTNEIFYPSPEKKITESYSEHNHNHNHEYKKECALSVAPLTADEVAAGGLNSPNLKSSRKENGASTDNIDF